MNRIVVSSLAACFLCLLLLSGCGSNSSSSNESGVVTLRIVKDNAPAEPAWVAFQDGDGPWQIWQPGSTGVYTATATNRAGRYSIALVQEFSATSPEITLYHGTVAELPEIRVALTGTWTPGTETITGTVNGFQNFNRDYAIINARDGYRLVYPNSPTFTLNNISTAKRDVIASLIQMDTSLDRPQKIAMLRDLLPNGTPLTADINFDTVPATVPATISFANGVANYSVVQLVTDDQTSATLAYPSSSSSRSSFTCAFPDPSQLVASDRFYADIRDDNTGVFVLQTFATAGNRTITLPAPLGPITGGLQTAGSVQVPTIDWPAYPCDFLRIIFWQPLGNSIRSSNSIVTAGWLTGASSYTMPDLSALDNWDPALSFSETALDLSLVEASTSNLPVDQALRFPQMPFPADGVVQSAAGVVTPQQGFTRGGREHLDPWRTPRLPRIDGR